jgi:tight adherence protein C
MDSLLLAVQAFAASPPAGAVLIAVFTCVILAGYGVFLLVSDGAAVRRRMAHGTGEKAADGGAFDAALIRIGNRLAPADRRKMSDTRLLLIRAGHWNPSALPTFYGARVLTGVAGCIAAALLLTMLDKSLSGVLMVAFAAASAGIGYLLPSFYISFVAKRRMEAFRNGFPDALDLLLVCVEAGLGLDQAMGRVAEEMTETHPIVSEHFEKVNAELRAGKTREDALQDFGRRLGIEEVATFASLLVQTSRLGASIGDALRVAADEMRADRLLRAEERAAKLPVKIALPLVMFLLPSLMSALMLPAVINVIRVLAPMGK